MNLGSMDAAGLLEFSPAWLDMSKSWWVVPQECIQVMASPMIDGDIICTLQRSAVVRVEVVELHGSDKMPWARLAHSEVTFLADTAASAWIIIVAPQIGLATQLAPVPEAHLDIAQRALSAIGLGPDVFDASLPPAVRGPKAAENIQQALLNVQAHRVQPGASPAGKPLTDSPELAAKHELAESQDLTDPYKVSSGIAQRAGDEQPHGGVAKGGGSEARRYEHLARVSYQSPAGPARAPFLAAGAPSPSAATSASTSTAKGSPLLSKRRTPSLVQPPPGPIDLAGQAQGPPPDGNFAHDVESRGATATRCRSPSAVPPL